MELSELPESLLGEVLALTELTDSLSERLIAAPRHGLQRPGGESYGLHSMNVILHHLRLALVPLAATLALASATTAKATPPQLVAVTQAAGHVTVTWQLPTDGSTSFRVQIASHPDAGGDGEFFSENIVADDILSDGQTSWTDIDALPAGIYFVHVSDSDLTCQQDDGSDCFSEQWSQTVTIAIPLTVAFGWGTTRAGHLTPNRAVAGGTLVISTWNPDGDLPTGTTGVCTSSDNLLLHQTVHGLSNGAWTCAYRLPKQLAGKHITVSFSVVFGTTATFLNKTISATVARR